MEFFVSQNGKLGKNPICFLFKKNKFLDSLKKNVNVVNKIGGSCQKNKWAANYKWWWNRHLSKFRFFFYHTFLPLPAVAIPQLSIPQPGAVMVKQKLLRKRAMTGYISNYDVQTVSVCFGAINHRVVYQRQMCVGHDEWWWRRIIGR